MSSFYDFKVFIYREVLVFKDFSLKTPKKLLLIKEVILASPAEGLFFGMNNIILFIFNFLEKVLV